MDEGDAKCEENARYSFLLGSALRNEDIEQFLQVYDAIVPKDLQAKEVSLVKEGARKVAELPQSEFDVYHRRLGVSLGLTAPSAPDDDQEAGMSSSVEQEAAVTVVSRGPSEGDASGRVRAQTKLAPSSSALSPKIAGLAGSTNATTRESLGDSGVFNESKCTVGSASDDDTDMAELQLRAVEADGRPPVLSSQFCHDRMVARQNNDAAYDDSELIVDSDVECDPATTSSTVMSAVVQDEDELQEVVVIKQSPDATLDGGIEMTTFRRRLHTGGDSLDDDEDDTDDGVVRRNLYLQQHNEEAQRLNSLQYDHAESVSGGEDDEDDHHDTDICGSADVSIHERLYGPGREEFASTNREEQEDYNSEMPLIHPRFLGRETTGHGTRSAYGPKTSDSVRIETVHRNIDKAARSSGPSRPPFDYPPNVGKVHKTVEELLDSRQSASGTSVEVINMPPGERITGSEKLDSEGNNTEAANKKKKKKKKNKEDGSGDASTFGNRNPKDASTDENGNPVDRGVRRRTAGSDIKMFGATSSSSSSSSSSMMTPLSQQGSHSYSSKFPTKLEELDVSNQVAGEVTQKMSRPTRRRAREAANIVKSENIEGFRGELRLDELLNFIENGSSGGSTAAGTGKKKKKVNASNSMSGSSNNSSTTNINMVNGGMGDGRSASVISNGPVGGETIVVKSSKKLRQSGSRSSLGNTGMGDSVVANNAITNPATVGSAITTSSSSSPASSQKDSEKSGSSSSASEKVDDSSSGRSDDSSDVKEVDVALEKAVVVTVEVGGKKKMGKTESAISDRKFIFTDFDKHMQPEDEFQVVKRKKQLRQAPAYYHQQPPSQHHQYNSHRDYYNNRDSSRDTHHYDGSYGGHGPSGSMLNTASDMFASRDDRCLRDERRVPVRHGRPMGRSVTPPPTSSTASPPSVAMSQGSEKDYYYSAHSAHSAYPYNYSCHANKAPVERAFSPSAFPALGGIGRRNSTGDVPSAVTPDDSDIESVKSLPLVAGAGNALGQVDGTLSPNMSYAKIAAGKPQAKGGPAVAMALESCVSRSDGEAEQPVDTGRRHSLPSLSDPSVEAKTAVEERPSSVTQTNSDQVKGRLSNDNAKEASLKEVLGPVQVAVPKTENVDAPSVAGDREVASESTVVVFIGTEVPLGANEAKCDISTPKEVVNPQSAAKTVSAESREGGGDKPAAATSVNVLTFGPEIGGVRVASKLEPAPPPPLLVPPAPPPSQSMQPVVTCPVPPLLSQKEFPAITDVLVTTKPTGPTVSQPAKLTPAVNVVPLATASPSPMVPVNYSSAPQLKAVAAPPPVTPVSTNQVTAQPGTLAGNGITNNRKSKTKSVVFMDKKAIPNTGISFGFDSNLTGDDLAVAPIPSDAPGGDLPKVVGDMGGGGGKVPNGLILPAGLTPPVAITADSNRTTLTEPVSAAPSVPVATAVVTMPPVASTQECFTPSPLEGGSTAVICVAASPPEDSTQVPAGSSASKTVANGSDGGGGASGVPGPAPSDSGSTGVPVAATAIIGDCPSKSHSKKVLDVQHMVPPARDEDKNYERGRFRVEDVVSEMRKEWDRTMEKRSRNPNKVVVYSSQ